MKRKTKKPSGRSEPFSGDRKLRSKLAGIPATLNTIVLDKLKDKEAEIKGECSKTTELQKTNKNKADKAVENKMKIPDDHAGELENDEDEADTDDLEEFDEVSGASSEEEQRLEEQETNGQDHENAEFSDDELSDEDDGKMNSDDSSNETERSELGNEPRNNTKPMASSTSETQPSKLANEKAEVAVGEKNAGKSRSSVLGKEIKRTELEKDLCNAVKLPKPSTAKNVAPKTPNERGIQLAGKNGGALSRTRDSGELRTRAELKNNLHNATMLTKPPITKINAGKTINEAQELPAVKNGAQIAGKPTTGTESLGSSSKTHQNTEGKKNQPLNTAIGAIGEGNAGGKKIDDHKPACNAVSKLDAEEDAIEEGCDVESSDEEDAILEVFDALGTKNKQTAQILAKTGSTALDVLAKTAKPNPEAKKSFAQLFKAENANKKGFKLEVMNKGEPEGDLIFEDMDVDKTTEAWGHSLIGYIAGKNPSYRAVIGYCKSWTHKCRVNFDASGWIVVKFDKEEDLKRVLEGGPYLIYGKPFIVKAMPKYFSYDKSELCKAQVWVNLPHLPLELWTARSLSMIGTRIGEPILVDAITASKERTSFARILVEVDLTGKLIDDIALVLPNGKRLVQEVRYEYLPAYCETCQAIGHDTKICARRRKQVEDQRIRIGATAVSHKPNATSSELASLKVSENPTFDASTSKSSKAQITEKTTEDSEDEFVEYLSKNRKKMLAKGKKQVGFQGSLDIEEIGAGINKAASQWQRKAILPKETATEDTTNPAGLVDPIGSETEIVDVTNNPAGLADPVGSDDLLAMGTPKPTVCALEAKSRVEETLGAVKSSVTESNVVKGTRVAEQRVVSHTTRSSLTYRDQKKGGNLPRSFR